MEHQVSDINMQNQTTHSMLSEVKDGHEAISEHVQHTMPSIMKGYSEKLSGGLTDVGKSVSMLHQDISTLGSEIKQDSSGLGDRLSSLEDRILTRLEFHSYQQVYQS